jgi:hypothetical protein
MDKEKTPTTDFADHQPPNVSSPMSQPLFDQLCELTKRWNEYGDIPKSQQYECRSIGEKLNAAGGMSLMRDAFYYAKGKNCAATTIQVYWDGVGDWRW